MFKIAQLSKGRFLAFCLALFLIGASGVTTYKVLSPKPAYAQCSCGQLCTSVFGGVSTAISTITSGTFVVEIYDVMTTVMTLFNTLSSGFNSVISAGFVTSEDNLETWFDNWIAYDLKPALQLFTGQLNTMMIDQNRGAADAADGDQLNAHNAALDEAQIHARRDATPNDQTCQAATLSPGLNRARIIKKALKSALPIVQKGLSGNEVGTSSEFGDNGYQVEKFNRYINRYCNAAGNAGNGCFGGPSGAYEDLDILVSEVLFKDKTIDLADATLDREAVVHDMVRNIAEPDVPEPMSSTEFQDPDEQELYLQKRAMRTKKALAKKVIYDVVAERAPGSRDSTYVRELRELTGVQLADISPNPSYYEVVNTLAEERYQSGIYNLRNMTEPEAVSRENVALQAIEVLRMNDNLELMNMVSMMIASQAAEEITRMGGFDNNGN